MTDSLSIKAHTDIFIFSIFKDALTRGLNLFLLPLPDLQISKSEIKNNVLTMDIKLALAVSH